jgi:cyclopropane fatty-acyl-phospholipid synthase-like methyltransferase
MKKKVLLLGAGKSRKKMIVHHLSPEIDFGSEAELTIHDFDPAIADATLRFDLETLPYPLLNDWYDEIHAYEVLEHTGRQGDAHFFFDQFRELWFALRAGGLLALSVPIWNSETAWGVPDHKRVFPPGIFGFLSPLYEKRFANVEGVGDYRSYRRQMDLRVLNFEAHAPSQRFFVLLQAFKDVDAGESV